jgi:hypothetical protein
MFPFLLFFLPLSRFRCQKLLSLGWRLIVPLSVISIEDLAVVAPRECNFLACNCQAIAALDGRVWDVAVIALSGLRHGAVGVIENIVHF